MKVERRMILLLGILWAEAPRGALALALRNSSAETVLAGLSPGRHYSLEELRHEPFRVVNSGSEDAAVELRVSRPQAGELKDGYEPIPDPAWIRLLHDRFSLSPGGEARSNALILVPGDRGLDGRQYQAVWISRATSPGGLKLDLRSKLLLIVDSKAEEIDRARRAAPKRDGLVFQLGRTDDRAEGVALGKRVDLKRAFGVSLKIVNLDDRKATFGVRLAPRGGDDSPRIEGYAAAPNPGFLKPEAVLVAVEGQGVGEARLSLEIPDEPRYRGRSWVFTVAVEALEAAVPKVGYYRLWVTTEGK